MIGRAALPNPGIFAELKGENISSGALGTYSTPGTYSTHSTFERHLNYLLSFRDQLAARFPNDHVPSADGFASVKMHVHLFRYFNGRPGAAALRARLNTVRTLAEIREICESQLT